MEEARRPEVVSRVAEAKAGAMVGGRKATAVAVGMAPVGMALVQSAEEAVEG